MAFIELQSRHPQWRLIVTNPARRFETREHAGDFKE
jgi:hypothetical protein